MPSIIMQTTLKLRFWGIYTDIIHLEISRPSQDLQYEIFEKCIFSIHFFNKDIFFNIKENL